jgi:hypothetical protein
MELKMADEIKNNVSEKDFRVGLTHKKSLAIAGYLGAVMAVMGGLAAIQVNLYAIIALVVVVTEMSLVTTLFICLQNSIDKIKIINGATK